MGTRKAINLIVSEDKNPIGSTKPGTRLDVIGVKLAGPKRSPLKKKLGARLCGGTSTCLALVEIERGDER